MRRSHSRLVAETQGRFRLLPPTAGLQPSPGPHTHLCRRRARSSVAVQEPLLQGIHIPTRDDPGFLTLQQLLSSSFDRMDSWMAEQGARVADEEIDGDLIISQLVVRRGMSPKLCKEWQAHEPPGKGRCSERPFGTGSV